MERWMECGAKITAWIFKLIAPCQAQNNTNTTPFCRFGKVRAPHGIHRSSYIALLYRQAPFAVTDFGPIPLDLLRSIAALRCDAPSDFACTTPPTDTCND